MGATEAFEFDLARCAEPDIGHPLERVPNRIADEDLATTGLSRYSRRHRNVEPEEVVSAPDRRAHVDAESHPDGPPTVSAAVQSPLHLDTAEHRLCRIAEGDHESVALALHHVAAVVVDELVDEFVVPLEHFLPILDPPAPGSVRWNPRCRRKRSQRGRRRPAWRDRGVRPGPRLSAPAPQYARL